MTPIKVSTTWINPETDAEYLIEAVVTPGERGTREDGFQVEPDSDDHVEITDVYFNGVSFSPHCGLFSKNEIECFEQALLEACEAPAEYED